LYKNLNLDWSLNLEFLSELESIIRYNANIATLPGNTTPPSNLLIKQVRNSYITTQAFESLL